LGLATTPDPRAALGSGCKAVSGKCNN
jgi:hypothetical protein